MIDISLSKTTKTTVNDLSKIVFITKRHNVGSVVFVIYIRKYKTKIMLIYFFVQLL